RLNYKGYKITSTKTTWGTCNSSKELTFNIKLAMAPPEVIEYVVVHELAHLKHMNHDRGFWNIVGRYLPDYKDRQDYLKKYGQFMNL
ncbi:MAG: M48 family metallopeptidase, partial [Gallicola sp.]|nr:M48 family metallopeptidase [Gallicola sp.]